MHSTGRKRVVLLLALTTAFLTLLPSVAMSDGTHHYKPRVTTVANVEFLGEAIVDSGTVFDDTEVGGLSSITYDKRRGVYYVISDDQGNRDTGDPVRYYKVDIDFSDGSLDNGDVEFRDMTQLFDKGRRPFAPGGVDPEGLVLSGRNKLYVSAEAILGDTIVDPFIRRYNRNGRVTGYLPIPDKYTPNGIDYGVRQNLSFESLNLTPNGRRLVAASEGALFQDGPASTFDNGSFARILTYDLRHKRPTAEYVYEVEPWAEPSSIFGVNGIVEVLPIDNAGTILVMERSFSVGGVLGGGTGNVVLIYEVSTRGATDVLDIDALYEDGSPISFAPVEKRLVFAFDDLGIPIDNIEGMTFGPRLPDGRRSLVIVSDNNFGAGQFTQFVVLALDIDRVK
ncbi:MAG: esterase-like activity of phytase family protein [bacterium]|nr:esterase-like activity of phytase family protein [bacterium]